MIYLIFDTETTGLPANYKAPTSDVNNWPRLVQLSWVITDGVERQEFDFIIKPDGYEIPAHVAEIHGITQERAMAEGRDREFILNIFRSFVNLADQIVAHNLDFDKAIVGAEYYRLFGDNRFEKRLAEKQLFCTMLKSTEMVGIKGTHAGQSKWPKLIELYKHFFNETFDGAHNSLNDTRACERCFKKLIGIKEPEPTQVALEI